MQGLSQSWEREAHPTDFRFKKDLNQLSKDLEPHLTHETASNKLLLCVCLQVNLSYLKQNLLSKSSFYVCVSGSKIKEET